MNLYEIRGKLEKQERAVFGLNEISRIIEKPKNISAVYANRMVKKGLLFKLEKNKFSVSEDIFVIASQLTFPSYLGLTTSLYLNNELSQIIDKIYVLSPKKKRKMKILGNEVIFIKINPKIIFGYKKVKKENSYIFISDIEKTIIDCILLNKYCNTLVILNALKKADTKKIEYYLSIIKKESLNRKIGFLLDYLEIEHSIKKRKKTIYKLNPSRKIKGKYNNKWRMYINEDLK